jgi:hypothetical protein
MICHGLDLVHPGAGEIQMLESLGLVTEGQSQFSGLGSALEAVQRITGQGIPGQQDTHPGQRQQQAQRCRRCHHNPPLGLVRKPTTTPGSPQRENRAVCFAHLRETSHDPLTHPIAFDLMGTDRGTHLTQRGNHGELTMQRMVSDVADACIHSSGKIFLILTGATPTPGCTRRPHRLRALGPCPWKQRAASRVVTPGLSRPGVIVIIIAGPQVTSSQPLGQ